MKKPLLKEILILLAFIAVFILIRSIHYVAYLNFSGDQASFSTKALEIWRTKKPVLIGPPISINLNGRQIFQGPAIYYFQLFFLLLGNFNPIVSSYLFMLFCALMIIPLYYGIKLLLNERWAIIFVAIYTLLPFYINFSRFLWNPTFQFSLLPVLILLMGLFKKNVNKWTFLGISFWLGLLLQFHYQFVLVIFGLFIYYLVLLKANLKYVGLFILGLLIGFSPLILFELRNHFYNTSTTLLLLRNWNKLDKPGQGAYNAHYYLSLSFMLLLALSGLLKFLLAKFISKKSWLLKNGDRIYIALLCLLIVILSAWAATKYSPTPRTAFWAASEDWNYLDDYKIYKFVKQTNIADYNIANLVYDTKAVVPKYLLKVDNVNINYEDYWHNKYLFVVEEKGKDYMTDPAYEVKYFAPSKLLQTWHINDRYNMYLLERLKT